MPTPSTHPPRRATSRTERTASTRFLAKAIVHVSLLATALVLVSTSGLVAQDTPAGLRAVVTAVETARPIAGAVVRVGGDVGKVALTDADGVVRIGGVRPGPRVVTVEALGYEVERLLLAFEPFAIVDAVFTLAPDPIPIEPIDVAVDRRSRKLEMVGFYERAEMRAGTFLTPDQTRQRAERAFQLSDMLRNLNRIRIVRTGFGTHAVVTRRGSASLTRTCRPRIWLDGAPLGDWASGDINRVVNPSAVAAVEIYGGPSETPTEFDPTGGACGAVLLWTGARPE